MLCKVDAVFIDRDGTIGGSDKLEYPGKLQLYPNVLDSMNQLKQRGIPIYSFTNQPGISRGEVKHEDFEAELIGFGFDQVYLCPHQHHEGCNCRKPATGMLLQAAKENKLNLNKCIVIGDRWTDHIAASQAGCMKILVKTGAVEAYRKFVNKEYYGVWGQVTPDYVAETFEDAVNWIIRS